ncbi:hypothetical protein ASF30_13180 [Leifsonia sp. Leaf264]|nr:hypothetical protein ASF30_13180 [Leifsonia sp. Leaf264]
MAAVIGLLFMLIVVSLVVTSAAASAAGFSTSTRALIQSQANANSGIEAVRAQLMAGNFVCAKTNASTEPPFSAVVTYTGITGPLACAGGMVAGTPTSAQIVSTGFADSQGVAGASNGNQAKVGATIDIQIVPGGISLDKAIFTEGSMLLDNSSEVHDSADNALDGNVYSNNKVTCKTDGIIEGTIYARGGLEITNTCKALGTIWVDGDVQLNASDVNLSGSVFATGKADLGKSHIGGNVVVNNNVTAGDSSGFTCTSGVAANVCGSIYSLGGKITLGNNGTVVKGSLYARGDIGIGGGNKTVAGNVVSLTGQVTSSNDGGALGVVATGGKIALNKVPNPATGYCDADAGTVFPACAANSVFLPTPSTATPSFVVELPMFSPATTLNLGTASSVVKVTAPPRQGMPQIFASEYATKWAGWTIVTAPANMCSSNNSDWTPRLDTLLSTYQVNPTIKLLVKFNCANAVTLGNDTVKLRGDLAFSSMTGFDSQNDLTIKSNDGAVHNMMWIVPSDSPGVTWSDADPVNAPGQKKAACSPSRDITLNKAAPDSKTSVFFYTPCFFKLTNGATFNGQIYSGSSSYPTGFKFTRAVMTVPGVSIPGGPASAGSVSVNITSRFDVTG